MKHWAGGKVTRLMRCLAAGLLVASCGGGGGVGGPPCSVDMRGDSILDAPAIEQPGALMARLQPSWQIQDNSIQGLSLFSLVNGHQARYIERLKAYGLPGAPFATQARTARVMVIELGGIDALELRDLATFEADLRGLVQLLHQEGRVVVLTGIVQVPVGEIYTAERIAHARAINAITLAVAGELGAMHAGWGEAPFAGEADTLDGIHRTQAASDALVARLIATIRRVCG